MTRPSTPHGDPTAAPVGADAAADRALQQALQALVSDRRTHDTAALEARVVAHWQTRHVQPAARFGGGPASVLQAHLPRQWVLAAALLLGATLVLGLWLQRPDPSIDELLHPDVLSQMAIGEM